MSCLSLDSQWMSVDPKHPSRPPFPVASPYKDLGPIAATACDMCCIHSRFESDSLSIAREVSIPKSNVPVCPILGDIVVGSSHYRSPSTSTAIVRLTVVKVEPVSRGAA